MQDHPITAQAIINDRFGGRRAVAAITGATPNAVAQWYRIGIPAKFWPILVDTAKTRKIDGITFDALASTKTTEAA